MIPNNMPPGGLSSLLQPHETMERSGIFVGKGIAECTVWDKHAAENPTHAVISAPTEAAAKEKSKEQIEDIKRYVKTTDIVLDFGAGYGRVAQYMLPEKSVAGYVAIDSSYDMLSLFKERYVRSDAEQRTPLLLLNADIHTVPLKNASVDTVIVCAVFLHNHKDVVSKAMAELTRVLKPGGMLLVYSSFPRVASFAGLQGVAYQILLNLLGKPFKNGPVRYYRKQEILTLHREFEEVEIHPVGFAVLPKTLIFLPGPLEKLYRNFISKPINRLLEKVCPRSLKPLFAVFYDVVAIR
jgi:ubiquinone/menaquinone biosynthesis C-methylase UbiE